MRTFLVECYWPGIESDCLRASERVSRLVGEQDPADRSGGGCILLPSDRLALFLLQAPSEVEVEALGRRAGMPLHRVVEAIRVGPDI
jgi:hypothetical protein